MTERERLIEILKDSDVCEYFTPYKYFRLAEHLLNYGVSVPPCKVGDTVWVVKDKKTITQYSVYRMIFTYSAFNYVILRGTNLNKHDEYACDFEDFGKTVFLTKEEAEKALDWEEN